MPNTMVVDLSHWNTIPSSLVPAKNAGVFGVIHKMTEGMGGIDATADNRYFLANDAGLLWGLYHFLRPGNMANQAKHFIDSAMNAGCFDDHTLLAADHEDPEVSLADLEAFLQKVEELSGRVPVIYSGHVLKDQGGANARPGLNKYRLWLAQYTSGNPTLPAGFTKYWIWQWTDKGTVPGINPPTDCNQYQGSSDDLIEEWPGSSVEPQPEPEPEPEPKPITIRVVVPPGVTVKVIEAVEEE